MFTDAVERNKLQDELEKRERTIKQLRNELRYMLDLVMSNLEVKDDLHVKYAQRLLTQNDQAQRPALGESEQHGK